MKARFAVGMPVAFPQLRQPLVPLYGAWAAIYRSLGPVDYPEPRGQGVDVSFLHCPVRQEPALGGGMRWTRLCNGRRVEADAVTAAELDRRHLVRGTLCSAFDRLRPYWRSEGSQDTPAPIVEPAEWVTLVMDGVPERASLGHHVWNTIGHPHARHPGRWEVFVDAHEASLPATENPRILGLAARARLPEHASVYRFAARARLPDKVETPWLVRQMKQAGRITDSGGVNCVLDSDGSQIGDPIEKPHFRRLVANIKRALLGRDTQ